VYDVVVIGSGYGGSVIAARLAARSRVLVIERGRRWRPGDLPRGLIGLTRAYMSERNPSGLWAMRLGRGTGNAFASALGGSSVINYGITVQPDDSAFDNWPVTAAELAPYFARARDGLGAAPNPFAAELGDGRFIDLVEPGRRFDLENTIDWTRCTACGHCVPGCNVPGAKRTLEESYLAQAIRFGAELELETRVERLVPLEDRGYAVELFGNRSVRARTVVLAAGTLGTLDILHRSREKLPLGSWLGRRMSMNGDGLAFLYNTRHQLSGHSGAPISTSARIPFVDDEGVSRSLMVMSGRVPRAAMRFAGAALAVASAAIGVRSPKHGAPRQLLRRLRDLARVDERGALAHTFMYKLDGTDDSRGTARFTGAGAVIDWDDYTDDPVNRFAAERLEQWAERVGGTIIPNVARLPGMRSFGVHPLGGARMATGVEGGVVDPNGRVFDPRGGLHDGLRIADASIFAGSIGVPPSLTVAALAERIADDMIGASS
jgi:cholesterol oxidase